MFWAVTLFVLCAGAQTAETWLDDADTEIKEAGVVLETAYKEYVLQTEPGDCAYVDACDLDVGTLSYDGNLSAWVDLSETCLFIPPDVDRASDYFKNFVCAIFSLNLQDWSQHGGKFKYYGDQQHGICANYPAVSWQNVVNGDPLTNLGDCDYSYDPRFRPWYSAAASGPKDVVVILDTSGSMAKNNRLDLAKDAGSAVLDTLTHNDFFNFITFSTSAHSCFTTMVRATSANKSLARDCLDTLQPSGETNFYDAFILAFATLEAGRTSQSTAACHRAILFMTDGQRTPSTEDPRKKIKELNHADLDARIFTYSFGADADTSEPLGIACSNKGIAYQVPDGANLMKTMASYYLYFAAGIVDTEVRWTEPFTSSFDSRLVTAGGRPVYDNSGDTPKLFGVICSEIWVDEILSSSGITEAALTEILIERSNMCPTMDLSEESIEELRPEEMKCKKSSTGVVVGAVIGGLFVVVVVIVVAVFVKKGSIKYDGGKDYDVGVVVD